MRSSDLKEGDKPYREGKGRAQEHADAEVASARPQRQDRPGWTPAREFEI